MIRIFIDTNKYLDFYRASDHSLSKLNTLIALLETKKIEVIIPKQVYCEFFRDKEIVYKQFLEENFRDIKVPGVLKDQSDNIARINRSANKIKEGYGRRVFSPKSKINLTFNKFFETAKIVPESPEILQAAYYRTLRGNPPRKNNRSFGDAIIWETLRGFSDKDLTIICADGDWSSELDKNVINPFLDQEWHLKDKKKIELYISLGAFLNKITDKPKIKKEVIEEEKLLDNSLTGKYFTGSYNNVLGDNIINFKPQSVLDFYDTKAISANLSDHLIPSLDSHYKINGSRACSCCGKSFSSEEPFYSIYANRCENCRDQMSFGRDCRECEKHYHESYVAVSISLPGLCAECSLKKNKTSIYPDSSGLLK